MDAMHQAYMDVFTAFSETNAPLSSRSSNGAEQLPFIIFFERAMT